MHIYPYIVFEFGVWLILKFQRCFACSIVFGPKPIFEGKLLKSGTHHEISMNVEFSIKFDLLHHEHVHEHEHEHETQI